jgi:hypothetical protein
MSVNDIKFTSDKPSEYNIFKVFETNHAEDLNIKPTVVESKKEIDFAPKIQLSFRSGEEPEKDLSVVPLIEDAAMISQASDASSLIMDVNELLKAQKFAAAEFLLGRPLTMTEIRTELVRSLLNPEAKSVKAQLEEELDREAMKEELRKQRIIVPVAPPIVPVAPPLVPPIVPLAPPGGLAPILPPRPGMGSPIRPHRPAAIPATPQKPRNSRGDPIAEATETLALIESAMTSITTAQQAIPANSSRMTVATKNRQIIQDITDNASWQGLSPNIATILNGVGVENSKKIERIIAELKRRKIYVVTNRNSLMMQAAVPAAAAAGTGIAMHAKLLKEGDYRPFGNKYAINMLRLVRGELVIRNSNSGAPVSWIRNSKLSPELKECFIDYLEGRPMDTTQLNNEERQYVNLLWKRCGITKEKITKTDMKLYQQPSYSTKTTAKKRLKVILGEIEAGNDNPQLLVEMGKIIEACVLSNWLPKEDIIKFRKIMTL